MYRIAIIDSDAQWAGQFHIMIRRVLETIGLRKCAFELYSNGTEFLENCIADNADEEEYFLVLLDTELDQVSGIQVARFMRKIERMDTIVFISSSNRFAMESYMVGAVHYVEKPVDEEQCYQILKRIIKSKRREDLELELRDGIRFRLNELCYIKYQKTGYTFSFSNQEPLQSKISPEEIRRIAEAFCCLYQAGDDLVLNFLQVRSIENNTVLFENGHYIHLPKKQIKETREAFLELQLERMQM